MMKPVLLPAIVALAFASPLAARAADLPADTPAAYAPEPVQSRFFVRAGVSGLLLNESASVRALGSRIPGATINIEPQVTASLEVGYFFSPNFAIEVTGGAPPKARIDGAGSIGTVGRLGSIIYGPTTATLQYHFLGLGRLQPYVGVGPAALFVFSEKDGAARNLKVDPAAGVVGQIGANYMLDAHWGVFGDVKAAWLGTKARGYLGGVPIKANVRLDPVVVSTGLIYKF
jgi:outer membrane protein